MKINFLIVFFFCVTVFKQTSEISSNFKLLKINRSYSGGGNVMCVCVCTKRVCVKFNVPKVYTVHTNLGICTVKESTFVYC